MLRNALAALVLSVPVASQTTYWTTYPIDQCALHWSVESVTHGRAPNSICRIVMRTSPRTNVWTFVFGSFRALQLPFSPLGTYGCVSFLDPNAGVFFLGGMGGPQPFPSYFTAVFEIPWPFASVTRGQVWIYAQAIATPMNGATEALSAWRVEWPLRDA